jgi:hypothetical protein
MTEEVTRVLFRLVGAVGTVVAFVAAESADPVSATDRRPVNVHANHTAATAFAGNPQGAYRAALFVTLPMTNGFADATSTLVETQGFVHEALLAVETVRLVGGLEESDAVLTVLGRGTGYAELTAALHVLDRSVVASPVMLLSNERYIEAMLTVGSCGDAAANATSQSKSPSCYRKIFVGLGLADRDARKGATTPPPNSWKACASALARDVQAWVTENASRLRALRGLT